LNKYCEDLLKEANKRVRELIKSFKFSFVFIIFISKNDEPVIECVITAKKFPSYIPIHIVVSAGKKRFGIGLI